MALHPLKLPRQSALLFRVVVLFKRLLEALADPALNANAVNSAWVNEVWSDLDAEWVRKFCLGGQEARIRAIAAATLTARQALSDEFLRQNKVEALSKEGGDLRDLTALAGVDAELAKQVGDFFKRCYKLLSHNDESMAGLLLPGQPEYLQPRYEDASCSTYPTSTVCPYRDGEIGAPELDHYLFKNGFPLLACSPWNVVPVCSSCNDVITAKGDRPPSPRAAPVPRTTG